MISAVDEPVNSCQNSPLESNVNHLTHFLLNGKAQRWISCEWFYSDIDWCLLATENEFERCCQHFFPDLFPHATERRSLQLTRYQWHVVRRRFGKPRRLSSAYLKSERMKLSKQRHLVRLVQCQSETRYRSERIFLTNLPASIVCVLQPGVRVIVRLFRSTHFGLHRGKFLSRLETNLGTYQILFDDPSIGLLNVNDSDVMSEASLETFLLADKLKSMKFGEENRKRSNEEDALPIRTSRILCAKRDSIDQLRQMNDQAIYERGEQIPLSDAFRRDYAQLIQWLAKLNEHLAKFIDEINQICRQIVTDDQLLVVFNDTNFVCQRAERIASDLVKSLNGSATVTKESNVELITKLVALVVQMKEFSESEGSFLELHAIDQANRTMHAFLHPSILTTYKRCVESSLTQFKSGLNNRPGLGFLQAFLHLKSNSNEQHANSSSMNQTFFSV